MVGGIVPEWIAAFGGCLLEGVIVVPVDYPKVRSNLCSPIASPPNVASLRAIPTGERRATRK